ncbi:MAG: hypothetical protein NUK65_02790 [Firmicutes bacterium]|nr:hypothetical protein [Bacillota bacterium]
MLKIKDRVALGVLAGLGGNLVKTAIDELSYQMRISQRSFRETASGVWVSKRQSRSVKGQILGGLLDFGMGAVGGIGTVTLLSKTGRDKLLVKGLVSGVAMGSTVTALASAFPQNRVRPKDAASNLSYMVSHAIYGVVTTYVAAKLGDPSVFNIESAPKGNTRLSNGHDDKRKMESGNPRLRQAVNALN